MKLLPYLLFTLIGVMSYSQECGTDAVMEKTYGKDYIDRSYSKLISSFDNRSVISEKVVPVVFHILTTDNDSYSFEESDVYQMFVHLNNAFMGYFSDDMENTNISFCLANQEVNNQSIGIQFHNLSDYEWFEGWQNQSMLDITFTNVIPTFAVENVLNIYVASWNSPAYSGFSQLPPSDMGVFVQSFYFSTESMTLIHEVGHYLGLLHTFQGYDYGDCESPLYEENCLTEGDFICDTPPTPMNFGCGYFCDNLDPPADIENFMDYSGTCRISFTIKQAARMHDMLYYLRSDVYNNSYSCNYDNPCPYDLNNDGVVNLGDLLIILVNYGQPGGVNDGNFNGTALVDSEDLLVLLTNFEYICVE